MHDRVFGLEFEYAVSHLAEPGQPRLPSDEVSNRAVAVANQYLRRAGSASYFWHNAGKLYCDVGHVEWASPECRSVREAVIFDKAGERLIDQVAAATEKQLSSEGHSGTVFVGKNNVDVRGNTFGCHENYLVARESKLIPDRHEFFTYLVRQLVPFLVSRTIICGSGRVVNRAFNLSQRAQFISRNMSKETRSDRPIINTRDEPHSDSSKYQRLHLILADANMAEWATLLKLGTTALVLEMIEDVFLDNGPELSAPVDALHAISRDPSLKTSVLLRNGNRATAIQIQRHYLDMAKRYFSPGGDDETRQVLDAWSDVLEKLEKLETDPNSLVGKLDWVTKKALLEDAVQAGLAWNDPRVLELDLQYHDVRVDSSVFYALAKQGLIETLLSDGEIERALTNPPPFTRAAVRFEAIKRAATIADWDEIRAVGGNVIKLPHPLDWCPIAALNELGLNEGEILSLLEKGLASNNPAVRVEALNGLLQVGTTNVLPYALRALDDREHRIRAVAAETLGKLGDPRATGPLRRAADDQHFAVRLRAEEALSAIGAS